jgi:hypothetical protein
MSTTDKADRSYHWATDPYWTEALDRAAVDQDAGEQTITLDLAAIDAVIFNADGPAYRLMDALASVKEHEA